MSLQQPADAYMVFPRRKRTAPDEERPPAMSITRESLQRLFCMRQVHAANHLGISLTAFKNACKHLGYDRWPYQKEGDGASLSSSPTTTLSWESENGEVAMVRPIGAGDVDSENNLAAFEVTKLSPGNSSPHWSSATPTDLALRHEGDGCDSYMSDQQQGEESDASEVVMSCSSDAQAGPTRMREEEEGRKESGVSIQWIEWFVGVGFEDPRIAMDDEG
ncbi:hypothetical protein GUITHDRAFT_118121 [Guillardia theta CCMP2712]|uniref:RWP-RK domain-containing protein n=1 Tax=Guillardia theta (strain CCMP2712) TaxID=905079 RepID=L1IHK9_GUITC|nr:hypothetical protein GUITHDRAFT_118121 [Guillardia theta CCMP2712]EKX35736.1 hypothetical protein GUITHDRAFT_118121 [Guillardia theta CCMP2712]|eukprot:XP_005822716.1 hypothetical protein GUITHDRAFT_118121 [Guillardia theta CCMP2712]